MTISRRRLAGGAIAATGLLGVRPSFGAKVALKLWMVGVGLEAYLKDTVATFEKDNPDISVEAASMGWTAYQQKTLTGIAANDGPDVVSFYSTDVASWAARGVLGELDGKVDSSLFLPVAMANGRWNGKIYALPLGMRMRPMFYRADFVKAAGFDGPPKTWDDLRTYASKLTKRDATGNIERVGFWVPTNHPYKTVQVWLAFFWNAGGNIFSDDGASVTFNGPEGVEATEYLASLLRVDKVDAPGAIKIDNIDFAQGRVAMLVSTIVTRNLTKNFPHLQPEVGICLVPSKKAQYIELSGDMIGISGKSRKPVEAAKLLNFIAARPNRALKFYEIDQTMPSLTSLVDSPYSANDPWIPTYRKFLPNARPLPVHPKWNEVADVITKALDATYVEGIPAKVSLDRAAATANDILRRT